MKRILSFAIILISVYCLGINSVNSNVDLSFSNENDYQNNPVNDSIIISNLYLIRETPNSYLSNDTVHSAPVIVDSVQYSVFYTINNPTILSEVYVTIGASNNSSDVISKTFIKVFHGGKNCLHGTVNPSCNKFLGGKMVNKLTVHKSMLGNAKWLTVWAKDTRGKYSVRKKYKI